MLLFFLLPPGAAADAPKVLGSVAVYTWEGNPANISCEVEAHPGASVVWFRDGFPLPSANSTNVRIHHTPTVSYLEVTGTRTEFRSGRRPGLLIVLIS